MTCSEFKELVAAWALGALEADERAACEQHLAAGAAHQGCAEELARARATASQIAASLPPVRPREEVWSAIAGQLDARAHTPAAADRTPRRRLAPWLLVAAAAAALILVAWSRHDLELQLGAREQELAAAQRDSKARLTTEAQARQRCERDLATARTDLALRAEAVALLAHPNTHVIALASQAGTPAGFRATAVVNLAEHSAVVIAGGVAAPSDRDYELWVIRGNDKVAAGLLHGGADRTALARIDPELLARGADAFAVTLEAAGGATSPHGPIVGVGAVPKT